MIKTGGLRWFGYLKGEESVCREEIKQDISYMPAKFHLEMVVSARNYYKKET